jgi:hypothetical protein
VECRDRATATIDRLWFARLGYDKALCANV